MYKTLDIPHVIKNDLQEISCGFLKIAGGATLIFETELVEVVGKTSSGGTSEEFDSEL